MAVTYIDWNDKVILECKKSIIEILRLQIEDIIRENKIKLNEDLTQTMEELDQAGYGIGFDLAEHLHTKKDILMFTDLVKKGIDKYNQERKDDRQNTGDLIEEFYKELATISESFPENDVLKLKKTVTDILTMGTEYLKIYNKLILNKILTKIMEDLNRASSRHGLPLAEYLHTKENLRTFIDLTKKAIDKYNQICQNAEQIARDSMENFYQELVKIGESFPE